MPDPHSALTDRARGLLLGLACGDALGAGYEHGARPVPPDGEPEMLGSADTGLGAGEWSDDTAQAWAVAEVVAEGHDLGAEAGLTALARRLADWYADGAGGAGQQTRAVLGGVGRRPSGADLTAAAADLHRRTGRTAGNGSLMRTAPLALARLKASDEELLAVAAAVSGLTHGDPVAGEACGLWTVAVRHALRDGHLEGLRRGLELLAPDRRDFWARRLEEAEVGPLEGLRPNGYVVTALQAAWAAVARTPQEGGDHLRRALVAAVRIGDDTDTVAAIAGGLLGARWGADAVPREWAEAVHGWPGARAADLLALADRALASSAG